MNAEGFRPGTVFANTRLGFFIALVFFVQVAAIYWLSDRTPPRQKKHLPEARMLLLGEEPLEVLQYWDATLLALPHARNFSGMAWLLASNTTKPTVFNWDEPPRFLPLQLGSLERIAAELFPAPPVMPPILPQRSAPDLATPGVLKLEVLRGKSVARLLSGPAEFNVVSWLDLPSITHSDLVSNTTVQVLANRDGLVHSASVIAGSGNSAADAQALAITRDLRVAPAQDNAALRWAIISFEWHTQPPGKAQ